MNELTFRDAERADVGLVLHFIKQLAAYEKMLDEVIATEEGLEEWIFDKGVAHVFFPVVDGKEVGFCLYFFNFSTFQGRAGLYLEDVYIDREYRGRGYGKAIFRELARVALEKGCGRMEWVCLNWNKPSIDFYLSMGAHAMDEWATYRMDRPVIEKLAADTKDTGEPQVDSDRIV